MTDVSGTDISGIDVSGANAIITVRTPRKQRRIGDVEQLMEAEYNDKDYIISTSLDILALYIKGQKVLYTEAKVYCEQQLNMLMLPAIFVSAVCTLLSVGLKDYLEGAYVVSGLTAINSFLLAIISYLKLDAKAEAHKTSAYMYDKLGSICEFNSGKVMFFKPEEGSSRDQITKLVIDIETKITEIKDTNKFILPEVIRYRYKDLFSQNLFSDVKALQINDLVLKTELKALLNKVDELRIRVKKDTRLQEDYDKVVDMKEKKIIEIIELRHEYIALNDKFKGDIEKHIEITKRSCCNCLRWLKT
jgi:hypothetical protein